MSFDRSGVAERAELAHFLEQSAALHHHLCPRQVLGARVGLHAADLLGLTLPQTDKRLCVLIETDGCFADGVSVTTGCWFGRRTLRLIDYGKVAATFVDTTTDRAIRIWPSAKARERAADYAPTAATPWEAYLWGYQRMPVGELLSWQEVRLTRSLAADLGDPAARARCSVCAEEIINNRQVVRDGAVLCQGCAEPRYYDVCGS